MATPETSVSCESSGERVKVDVGDWVVVPLGCKVADVAATGVGDVEGKVDGRRKTEHSSATYPETSPVDEVVLVAPDTSARMHRASTANVAWRACMVCFNTSNEEILPFA